MSPDPLDDNWTRLPEGTAAAIIEFMLSALAENPHRIGGRLQRELAGLHSARRGAYRVGYEIDDDQPAVIVLRIDHRSSVYRARSNPSDCSGPRLPRCPRTVVDRRDGTCSSKAPV